MSSDAIDLLFDWRDERDREANREEDDPQPQPDARSPPHWRPPRKPWPPREVTEEELASGPTRKCNRCERVYPDTSEFFGINRSHGRIYYYRACRGCRRKAARQPYKERCRNFGFRVNRIQRSSRERGIEWGYDNPEDLREFWDAPCHYCGGEVEQHLGLDRIENDKGYIPGNVVQCCWTCNRMKWEHSVDEWVAHMRRVLEHLDHQEDQE